MEEFCFTGQEPIHHKREVWVLVQSVIGMDLANRLMDSAFPDTAFGPTWSASLSQFTLFINDSFGNFY
jgi:hypothetical protein